MAGRLEEVLTRAQQTTAGRVHRRVMELDLVHQAMVLAALAMMLLIPALITLQAVVPLGDAHGVAQTYARRLGLSQQATSDLQHLFGGPGLVRASTSWLGAAVTLLSAYAWPTALKQGYELAWHLPARGLRDAWRPLLWLAVLLGGFAVLAALGAVIRPEGSVLVMVAAVPVVGAWTWWTQHLLLGGRVGWRPLLPGAVTMTLGLYALRIYGTLSLSSSISGNYDRYGPIGIVFTLLSWFIGFCVVMLGGAVVGAELWDARQHRLARQEPERAIERIRRSVRRSQ